MTWFRVDNRLVHGQVIESWLPYLGARTLVVVNDRLAKDALQQQIMQLAIPGRIKVSFISVADIQTLYSSLEAEGHGTLFLFADCADVMRVVEQGVPVPILNIGNMHYAPGKRQLCPHVAVSEDDLLCFEMLKQKGARLDFRSVPGDMPLLEDW